MRGAEDDGITKHLEYLKGLATELLKDVQPEDVRRVLSRICNTYSYLGGRTLNQLRQLEDVGDMIRLVCQKLEDVDPLLKLPKLLDFKDCDALSRYREALIELQETVQSCPVECTSPPGSPVAHSCGGVVLFFSMAHISPAVSPTQTIHSAFPAEVKP